MSPLSRHLRRIALLIEFRENLIDDAPAEASELTTVAVEGLSRLSRGLSEGGVHDSFSWVEDSSSLRWGEILRLFGTEDGDDGVEAEPADVTDPAEAPAEIAVEELIRLVSRNNQARQVAESSRSALEDDDEPPTIEVSQLLAMLLGTRDRARPSPSTGDVEAPVTGGTPSSEAREPSTGRPGKCRSSLDPECKRHGDNSSRGGTPGGAGAGSGGPRNPGVVPGRL